MTTLNALILILDISIQISRSQFGPAGKRSCEEPKKDKQNQLLHPQNAEGGGRSPNNFQRQRSFVTKENNQKRWNHGPLTSANSPPRHYPVSGSSNSPNFKRTRTISCIETTGVQNRGFRGRNSNSISLSNTEDQSLNPQAKEFVIKKEVNIS